MKRIIYSTLALTMILFAGCKKFVDGYDKSPNDPISVTPALLLSNCEVAYFATANGQLSRQASMMIQQNVGVDFQSRDVNDYSIEEGTNVNEWTVIYANGLVNLKKLHAQSGTANPYYQGISRILTAMYLGVATDFWGDVPSREAVNGLVNLNPNYDAQKTVIEDIQTYLDEGITLLSMPEASNVLLPGTDDYIYQGDAASWIAAAHVIKARYYNRLSKRDAGGSATSALTALSAANTAGFTSNANNMNATFGDKSNEYNQWYAFTVVERAGYIKTGLPMTTLMNSWNDPRLPFYCAKDTGGLYSGSAPEEPNLDASEVGPYLATQNAPFPLVTFAEAKFIEAEVKLRSSDPGGAANAHNDAVIASVLAVTGAAASPAFVAAQASETSASITLEKIMNQKYVALYGQIEAYADWRRTNFPTLTPNSNGNITEIPRRLPTVIDERLYNTNAPSHKDLKERVWWDQ
ncbi:MAG: SusD/RagB family nutrient-binding outer membrane lipoprotein [bacterium]|nr:SusD/RagB family nutrient-binding outer membrane lipoprotein [bacterium]